MIRRLMRLGIPVGGVQLLLAGGAAYFAWEHDQGKHEHSHPLCAVCWLNKIAPAPETPKTAEASGTPAAGDAAPQE